MSLVFSKANVTVPLGGVVDLEREKQRLSEELEKMTDNLQRLTARLSDERFLAKAPEEVVERERERLGSTESRRARVAETLARLGG